MNLRDFFPKICNSPPPSPLLPPFPPPPPFPPSSLPPLQLDTKEYPLSKKGVKTEAKNYRPISLYL